MRLSSIFYWRRVEKLYMELGCISSYLKCSNLEQKKETKTKPITINTTIDSSIAYWLWYGMCLVYLITKFELFIMLNAVILLRKACFPREIWRHYLIISFWGSAENIKPIEKINALTFNTTIIHSTTKMNHRWQIIIGS